MPNAMEYVIQRALGASPEVLAEAMNRGFEGYVQPVQLTPEAFDGRFRPEHIDLGASRVLYAGGSPVGLVLVSRRGWSSRIAAMGVAPELRGSGAARRSLQEVLDCCRARGDHRVLLEVIVGNGPAIGLYLKCGFQVARTLVGHVCEPASGAEQPLVPVDPLTVARLCGREGEEDLPWMMESETLAAAGPSTVAFTLEGAAGAIVRQANPETLILRALVVARARRRQGLGRRLLEGLHHLYPGARFHVPAIVPQALAPEFFEREGFKLDSLSQYEMVCDLMTKAEP